MRRGDLDSAQRIHERMALEKLKSSNLSKVRVGIQEVAELGGQRPFRKGFNALATELARRRKWAVRFEILDALNVVAGPIRKGYE